MNYHLSARQWMRVALSNFLLAAILGALMRYAFVEELSWMKFRNILHAHSHVAMLGWVYPVLMIRFLQIAAGSEAFWRHDITANLWIAQVSVWGMLIAFPIQGYGPVAIAFSTIHVFSSYYLTWVLWRMLSASRFHSGQSSYQLIRYALGFMVLSTLGLWAMPPVMAAGMQGSLLYIMAVQFYLHFQLNGWFIFGVLALLIHHLENRGVPLHFQYLRQGIRWLAIGTVLTYALALSWATPTPTLFAVNGVGVLTQLTALLFLIGVFRTIPKAWIRELPSSVRWILRIGLWSFAIKILIQSAVIIPVVAQASYTVRNLVIGFLHLILLGLVTHLLVFDAREEGLIRLQSGPSRLGGMVIGAGFLLSEAVLFLQGCMFWANAGFLPGYHVLLFSVSALIPLGVAILLFSQLPFAPSARKA